MQQLDEVLINTALEALRSLESAVVMNLFEVRQLLQKAYDIRHQHVCTDADSDGICQGMCYDDVEEAEQAMKKIFANGFEMEGF